RGQSKDVGPAADVYALGALLYETLTGRPPFVGETDLETLLQVETLDPAAPSRLRPKLPRDLETICLKCLHKDPHRRYASAQDLAAALRRVLGGEAIRARPVGWPERLWRWCRRQPAVAGLTGAVAALLLLVTVGSVLGAWRQAELRTRADQARQDAQAAQ